MPRQPRVLVAGLVPRVYNRAGRDEAVLEWRELAASLAVERWGVGVKELAESLGKSRDGASHWVRRAARRRSAESAFARRLEALDRKLARSLEPGAASGQPTIQLITYLAPITRCDRFRGPLRRRRRGLRVGSSELAHQEHPSHLGCACRNLRG